MRRKQPSARPDAERAAGAAVSVPLERARPGALEAMAGIGSAPQQRLPGAGR